MHLNSSYISLKLDSLEECVRRLLIWQEAVEKKDLRVNARRQRS